MDDPVLSTILDTILVDNDSESDQQLAKQKIHEIEQQLMWVEQTMGPGTISVPSSLPMSPMTLMPTRVVAISPSFQQPGVIQTSRDQIRILDRRGQQPGITSPSH